MMITPTVKATSVIMEVGLELWCRQSLGRMTFKIKIFQNFGPVPSTSRSDTGRYDDQEQQQQQRPHKLIQQPVRFGDPVTMADPATAAASATAATLAALATKAAPAAPATTAARTTTDTVTPSFGDFHIITELESNQKKFPSK
jgi:hypothetical protein